MNNVIPFNRARQRRKLIALHEVASNKLLHRTITTAIGVRNITAQYDVRRAQIHMKNVGIVEGVVRTMFQEYVREDILRTFNDSSVVASTEHLHECVKNVLDICAKETQGRDIYCIKQALLALGLLADIEFGKVAYAYVLSSHAVYLSNV